MMKITKFLSILLLIPQVCFGAASQDFNGTTSIVNCGSGTSLDNLTAVTILGWSHPDSEGENQLGRFVDKTVSGQGVIFYSEVTDNQGFAHHTTTGSPAQLARITALNTWAGQYNRNHSFVATSDGTLNGSNVHIYLDLSEPSYLSSTNGGTAFVDDSSGDFNIGNRADTARTFDGELSHVQIFNVVLTEAEYKEALWKPGIVTRGLVLWVPLWDGASETNEDLSGNGNHCTPTNTSDSAVGMPVMHGGGLSL